MTARPGRTPCRENIRSIRSFSSVRIAFATALPSMIFAPMLTRRLRLKPEVYDSARTAAPGNRQRRSQLSAPGMTPRMTLRIAAAGDSGRADMENPLGIAAVDLGLVGIGKRRRVHEGDRRSG